MNRYLQTSSLALGVISAFGFALASLPGDAQAQSACIRATQGRIAWNYKGTKKWAQSNLQRLCKGASSEEPARCFQRVMHGNVSWGSSTKWKWNNAIDLCEQSESASRTISCFKKQIKRGVPWSTAISRCDERARRAPPPPPPARRTKVGVFTLKSHHNKFVVAEAGGEANANRGKVGPWEKWTMLRNPNGTVSFRSHHGKYLVAESDGRARANRDKIGPWEQWKRINNRDGTVSFRSHHGKYLVAEADGNLNANRDAVGPWERFRLQAPGAAPPPPPPPPPPASGVRIKWNKKPGAAKDIGVGPRGAPWVIGTDRQGGGFGIYRWRGNKWQKVTGSAVRIDVGPNEQAWVVNKDQYIYRWEGDRWKQMPGRAYDVGVGANGAVWVIGTDRQNGGYGIYRWQGSKWKKMPGAGVRIDVDRSGKAWVVNDKDRIYRWTGRRWEQKTGRAKDIGIGSNGEVWVVGTNRVNGGYSPYLWTGSGWRKGNGGIVNVTVGRRGNPLGVNEGDKIFFGRK